MRNGRAAVVAGIVGLVISGVLFGLSYAFRAAFWPQLPGYYVTWVLYGLHEATEKNHALTAIPVNAVVYALVIFTGSKLRRKSRCHQKRR